MYSEAVSSSLGQESQEGQLLTYKNFCNFCFLTEKQGGYLAHINWHSGHSVWTARTDTQAVSVSAPDSCEQEFKFDINYVKWQICSKPLLTANTDLQLS